MIVCFSGTGNSLSMARDLSRRLGDEPVISFPEWTRKAPVDLGEKPLVLVFPVFAFGPPKLVWELILRGPFPAVKPVYAVATCGGEPGGALQLFEKRIHGRGGRLTGGFFITEWDKWFGRVPAVLARIEKTIREGGETRIPHGNAFITFLSSPLYKGFCRRVGDYGRKFRADEKCTKCGLCAKVCPTGNITVSPERGPGWARKCEACLACYAWCPAKAINLSWMKRLLPVSFPKDVKASDVADLNAEKTLPLIGRKIPSDYSGNQG